MRAVLLTPVNPYPPTKGTGRRIISMSQRLASKGHQITIISIINPTNLRKLKPTVLKINDNLQIVFSHFWNGRILRELLSADIIQFEYPFLLPIMLFLRLLGRPIILDEHGVEAVFIKQLKTIPLGQSESRSTGFTLRTVPGLYPIVLAIEKMAVTVSSFVFLCSQEDASEIRRLYGTDEGKLLVVPNCADPSLSENVAPFALGRPTVLFLGSFEHLPNLQGAYITIKEIIPRVSSQVKNVLFVFVGKNPPQWLLKMGKGMATFTGEVEDFRPLVHGADVVIAPILSGSGTRQKIVDYMALGKPIVATSKGAEGLELKDGVHFLRRDSMVGFSEAIVWLLKNKRQARQLGMRARGIAIAKYSWSTQVRNVLKAYEKIAAEKVA